MSQIKFALAHYLVLALLALTCYLLGRRLTVKLQYSSLLEQICFSLALGLGCISLLVALLGLLHGLQARVLYIVLGLVWVACYSVWPSIMRGIQEVPSIISQQWKRDRLRSCLCVLIIGLLWLPVLKLPLLPPTAFDATFYHLPLASTYVESHALVFTPQLRFAVLAQANHMLFTLALLLQDDILAQLIQTLILALLAASVLAFGTRLVSPAAGWWGLAILLSSPLVLWSGTVAYIDIGLVMFVFLAVYAFWNWREGSDRRWLLLSAVLCGFAIGTKYNALPFLVLLSILALYEGGRQRDLKAPLVFAGGAVLTAAPWFLRNFYYTRNPLYPFFYRQFGSIFGYGALNADHYRGLFEDIPRHGIGQSVGALIRLPWYLAYDPVRFVQEAPLIVAYAPLILALVGLSFLFRRVRLIAVIGVVFALFWFFSIQVMRYLLPAVPLMALAAGVTLFYLTRWLARWTVKVDELVVILVASIILSFPGWRYAMRMARAAGPIPVNLHERETYLSRALPGFGLVKWLNERHADRYKVYALAGLNLRYFARGQIAGDWFGQEPYWKIAPLLRDSRALHAQLLQFGCEYLLFEVGGELEPQPDASFGDYFVPLHTEGNLRLYKLAHLLSR